MKKIIIFAFIFWGIGCFLLGSLVHGADETLINRADMSFTYKWISIASGTEDIAYVDEDCKIITIRPISKYKYIVTELERCAGLCREHKELAREIKEKN